jgi:hypothetical protein
MRKGILFSLLCLIAIVSVACGSGNNATKGNGTGNAANGGGDTGGDTGSTSDAADAFALYKKKGTTWTTKNVTKIAGMDDMISYSKNEIVEVTDKSAKVKTWMLDKDQKPMAGMEAGTEYEVKFETPKVETGTDAPKVETKEETVKVEAGEFECIVTETGGNKVWSSKKYPGLMVKMTHASGSSELVSFKEG